jgi:hypothetical protein
MIAARAPIVTGVAVDQEAIWCTMIEAHGERAIVGGVSRPRTADGVRPRHLAAQRGGPTEE